MKSIHQTFKVSFSYSVFFTEDLFNKNNPVFRDIFDTKEKPTLKKIFFVIDSGVNDHHSLLINQIKSYLEGSENLALAAQPIVIPGGEKSKNSTAYLEEILSAINTYGIDRHAYLVAIGGGAVLDMAGLAAAIAHRGVRHIRIPTTVLSQNDSGVGVKNSINAFQKKNFLGTFAPPYAVINDFRFLHSLEDRDWRAGIAEAIKVALIRDGSFFAFIKENASQLRNRNLEVMKVLIHKCAKMHMEHIAGGDPFEMGSSRPLDFGHWAAHKIEQLSHYAIRHGEAVAMGICLDSTYAYLSGMLPKKDWQEIINLTKVMGFRLYYPELSVHLDNPDHPDSVLKGLTEFREHLGGELTIMLLDKIGHGVEVHEMNHGFITKSIQLLKQCQEENRIA